MTETQIVELEFVIISKARLRLLTLCRWLQIVYKGHPYLQDSANATP